jgi:hypothetical protein
LPEGSQNEPRDVSAIRSTRPDQRGDGRLVGDSSRREVDGHRPDRPGRASTATPRAKPMVAARSAIRSAQAQASAALSAVKA